MFVRAGMSREDARKQLSHLSMLVFPAVLFGLILSRNESLAGRIATVLLVAMAFMAFSLVSWISLAIHWLDRHGGWE